MCVCTAAMTQRLKAADVEFIIRQIMRDINNSMDIYIVLIIIIITYCICNSDHS